MFQLISEQVTTAVAVAFEQNSLSLGYIKFLNYI